MKNLSFKFQDRTVGVVALSQMFPDPEVQRQKLASHVNRIRDDFDIRAVKPFTLSLRKNGKYSILDGQQEWHVLQTKGITQWPAVVFDGLTKAEECLLLNKLNDSKQVQPRVKYRNAVRGGDKDAVAVDRIVTANGFQMGLDRKGAPRKGTNVIRGVAQIQKIYKSYTGEVLDKALKLIRNVFTIDDAGSVDQYAKKDFFIRGVALFFVHHDISVEDASERLEEHGATAEDYWAEAVSRFGNDRKGVEEFLWPQLQAVVKALRKAA